MSFVFRIVLEVASDSSMASLYCSRLDELGVALWEEEEEPCDAHRHRGVAPAARAAGPHWYCFGGLPRSPRYPPGDVRSRATTRRRGHLVSTRGARSLPRWARLGSPSGTICAALASGSKLALGFSMVG